MDGNFGGVFSDTEIRAAIKSGQIVLDPYDDARIQNSSVDVTLGGHFFKMERDPQQNMLNPYDPESINQYFKPLEAMSHEQWLVEGNIRRPLVGIPLDQLMFLLRPNERILAHTAENIGIAYGGTTMMHAKSTTGRYGISVCDDAGWGDQGYVSRWTLEIKNKNEHASVPLIVGMPIAQVIFFKMAKSDAVYGRTGSYQQGTDLAEIKRLWSPGQNMRPRLLSVDEITPPRSP